MGKLLEALKEGLAATTFNGTHGEVVEKQFQDCLDVLAFLSENQDLEQKLIERCSAILLQHRRWVKTTTQKENIDDTPKLPFAEPAVHVVEVKIGEYTKIVLPEKQAAVVNDPPIQAVVTRVVTPTPPPQVMTPTPPVQPAVQQTAIVQAFPHSIGRTPTAEEHAAAVAATVQPASTPSVFKFVESDELWACDVCGAATCAFGISFMTSAQRGDSIFVPYKCLKCNAEGNAMLSDGDVKLLVSRLPKDAFACVPVADAAPKKGRKKAADAAPAPEVAQAAPAAPFSPPQSTAQNQDAVAALFAPQESEVDLAAAEKVVRGQVEQWPLETLIKEWEAFTGKTYVPNQTVPATMANDVIRKLAGLPMV